MSVYLSPVGNGQVFLTTTGLPANNGYIYTYQAGTSNPAATYTTSLGNVANTYPIRLTPAGMAPAEIWLTGGQAYKFVVTDVFSNPIGVSPYDNLYGINDPQAGGQTLPATSVTYTPPGAGAVATTVGAALGFQYISVFRWLTDAQIADVQNKTAVLDLTSAIQMAINALSGGYYTLFFPDGFYRTTASLVIPNSYYGFRMKGTGYGSLFTRSTSFDCITFANPGGSAVAVNWNVIEGFGFTANGITGTGSHINTQYRSDVFIRDVMLFNLETAGNGIIVQGNGTTYSHEVTMQDVYCSTSTGFAGIFLTGNSSDGHVTNFIMNGNQNAGVGCQYGVYVNSGAGTWQLRNIHPYGCSVNSLFMSTPLNAQTVWTVSDSYIDASTQDCAFLNGTTNATFSNCMFQLPPSTYSCLKLTNATDNKFTDCSFVSVNGIYAVNETGTSNRNTFNQCKSLGTFSGIPVINLAGAESNFRPQGTDLVVSGVMPITAGGTIYIGMGLGNASEAAVNVPIPKDGYIRKLLVQCTAAPGAGQSFTATVRDNSADTTMVATISGGASFGATTSGMLSVPMNDNLDIKIVASGGASASTIRATLVVNQ